MYVGVDTLPTWAWWTLGVLAASVGAVAAGGLAQGTAVCAGRRLSRQPAERGNRLFPTQVLITPTSVVQYTPQWIGRQEESIHMAHIASVKIITGLLLSDVLIETSGGASPIKCHGHRKQDAVRMKALIEGHQNDYYRSGGQSAAPGAPAGPGTFVPGPVAPVRPADNSNAKMDDVLFSARRASAGATREICRAGGPRCAVPHTGAVAAARRHPSLPEFARPTTGFDVEALMQTFGRLRLDVENCVRELADFGVARMLPGQPPQYIAERPENEVLSGLLDTFLERRAAVSTEDQSPSVQRFREMIGRDEKMLIVFEWIRTAAKSDISVLILGPTGSGKEVVARMIHELSRRAHAKFQAVNCAALPDTLFESEIFGYEKGAFTGAHDRKPGRLELANEGTLFLDEIADTSLIAQAKLLRVLEERRFERLGGQKSISVDFRLISATNRPLEQFVRDGRFREDLYYRVNAFAIRLPSLRERQVDIPVLAERFLARYCAAQGLPLDSKSFSREALDMLMSYPWPGNIRELESTVSRAALSAPGRTIRGQDIEFLHATRPVSRYRRRSHAVARRGRTRAHRPRARSGAVEQEGSGARARYQPRHAVSQD